MDRALLSFLINSNHETTVPHPWERCYDVRNEILYYKNVINGSMVVDLRSPVDLGGGLYHVNNMWEDLTGSANSDDENHCPASQRRREAQPPHLIVATCCGPSVYLLVPEMVSRCPLCDDPVRFVRLIMT
ncbi:hypothetical protein Tsubulata_015116 [Turnera subulata]|uniref:Uncharacterized protein n=1 Tax=Turnera subulata TaxID=218843 RepID=A0A9Q0F1L4_9ROSI|nr:hypothetical protein Tsubulata_015116 [Turnera subulata]